MKKLISLVLLTGCIFGCFVDTYCKKASLEGMTSQSLIPNQYIVLVKSLSDFKTKSHVSATKDGGSLKVQQDYRIAGFSAVLVQADLNVIEHLREDDNVLIIETDQKINVHKGLQVRENLQGLIIENLTEKREKKTYIVSVKGGANEVKALKQGIDDLGKVTGQSVRLIKELSISDWHGLVMELDEETARTIRQDPRVLHVEENKLIKAFPTTYEPTDAQVDLSSSTNGQYTTSTPGSCIRQFTSSRMWGLSRISSHNISDFESASYKYSKHDDGEGVYIYVIDSGVYEEHDEFEGRASWGMTAAGVLDEGKQDLDGHGTHVASIAAGKLTGAAKKAQVVAVKVLDRHGEGKISDIIEGIEWTVKHIRETGHEGRSIVNLSIGAAGTIILLEAAVQAALESGVPLVIAAGNDAIDACKSSPARVSGAITVAAITINDTLATFSNYGPCVDIAAPGTAILGASNIGISNHTTMQGTSMAAPFVTGVVARRLSSLPANSNPTPYDIRQFVIDTATKERLQYVHLKATPDRLLYMSCSEATPTTTPELNTSSQCQRQEIGSEMWSLARINSREPSLDYSKGVYAYDANDGKGVNIYVLDTGVFLQHEDFGGRAKHGYTATVVADEGDADLNGHGTLVASVAAGMHYGVAKAANIISVKVLNETAEGKLSGILEALEWVENDIKDHKTISTGQPRGFVVNLSLGLQGSSISLESILERMMSSSGICVVAAAGNNQVDACNISPARMSSIVTVGATDNLNSLASFSNYGSCVDMLAPGQSITGAHNSKPKGSQKQSGTSFAAPYVTGAIASYLSGHNQDQSPAKVLAHLLGTGSQGLVDMASSTKASTPNILLYTGCETHTDLPDNSAYETAGLRLWELFIFFMAHSIIY